MTISSELRQLADKLEQQPQQIEINGIAEDLTGRIVDLGLEVAKENGVRCVRVSIATDWGKMTIPIVDSDFLMLMSKHIDKVLKP